MARYILEADQELAISAGDNTNGTARRVDRYALNKAVQFGGTFGGGKSLQLQGTINGTDWVSVGAAVTTAGTVIETSTPWFQLRVHTTTQGTGTATATIGGHDHGSY